MPISKYKTKEGMRYRAEFKYQGQRHTQAGFRKKQDAKDWISDEKRRLKNETPIVGGFSEVANDYLDDIEGRMQPNTVSHKAFAFRSFISSQGDLPLATLSREHIKAYLREQWQERGAKAANRDLRELHALFAWAINEGRVQYNPASHIEKYPEERAPKYVPPVQDVAAVIMAANREERDFIEAYCNTAARMGELLQLRKQDVDLARQLIWVYTKKRKGGEKAWRSIALNRTMLEIIQRRMKQSQSDLVFENPRTGGPYHRNQHVLKYLLTRLCKKAKVKRFTIHAFRHFASVKAAAAYEKGEISLRELQKLLGHQKLSTTEIYIESLKTDTKRVTDILERDEEAAHDKENEG